jgi:hypothetical protein
LLTNVRNFSHPPEVSATVTVTNFPFRIERTPLPRISRISPLPRDNQPLAFRILHTFGLRIFG